MAGMGQFLVDYVQPGTEKFLGIDDEATKARKDARRAAQERINMAGFDANSNILPDNSNMNQDGYEDTLSHLLAGAYTTSEGGLDLGKRTGNALLNLREHFTDEGEEKNIDINNNNLGKIIAEFRMSKEGGELRGDALQEQILEDSKMLASSVSKFSNEEEKTVQEYLYNEQDGLMHQLDNFLGAGRDINTLMSMLSTKGMNKGGMMDNQMVKAFAIGGEVMDPRDPISGNEVPQGSFPNEVRDDVPAMLSEGEYVVPADVLRFYGLKFFEDLRGNAKVELQRMSQEGRIGGEPVQEPQNLNDQEVVSLERMMRNANNGSQGDVAEMANGGLIDKLANTIKTNSDINQRLAKGGVVIKMAPGGLVSSSLYQDPTKMDAVIKEVTAASKTNPALYQRLASKGVILDKTNATMDSEEMLNKNKPMFNIETGEELVRAAQGGLTGYANSGMVFDPSKLFYPNITTTKPKKSTDTFKNEEGESITVNYEINNGIKMITGYTRNNDPEKRMFPLPLPTGFTKVETPASTQMTNLKLKPVKEFEGGPDDTTPPDTTAWASDLNFNNLSSIQDYVDGKTKAPSGLASIFSGGIIGAASQINTEYQLSVISLTTTNSEVKSYVDAQLAEIQKNNKNPFANFLRGLFGTPTETQIEKYIKNQLQLTSLPTFQKEKTDTRRTMTELQDRIKNNTFTKDTKNLTRIADSKITGSKGVTSKVNIGGKETAVSDEGIDMSNEDTASNLSDVSKSIDKSKESGFQYGFNKGGLASKKSKKGYDKGGYYTNKKMNTGGLVKKKKKK